MTNKLTRVAVYWTLKEGFGNNPVLQGTEMIWVGSLECYYLTDVGFPKAIFTKTETSEKSIKLFVELYDVTDDVLAWLDWLEGNWHFYQRKELNVGDFWPCRAYEIMNETSNTIDLSCLNRKEDWSYTRIGKQYF